MQLFPANGEQGHAAWTKNKQENEDQIQADNGIKRSGRITQKKYKLFFPQSMGIWKILNLPRPLFELRSIHGRRNFKDTNPLMSSLLVIFVRGGEAIL